jgi:polysaccharide export outer membrane protein
MSITTVKVLSLAIALNSMAGAAFAQSASSAPSTQQTVQQFAVSERGPLQNIPISPGDLLDVEVFNTPELSGRLRVDQQGFVTLPLGGDVNVHGLLTGAAAESVRKHLLTTKMMLNPTVTVSILEYSSDGVTVLGEVRSPGIYTLLGPRSLYDALAAAGGVTDSEGSTITITHANDATHPIVVNVTTTDYSPQQKATVILPGDTVVVNRAPLIYVVGDVARSGAFYLRGGTELRVLDLIALAQGANRTAAMKRAALVRSMPDGTAQTIHFDLDKVMRNQSPNLAAHAGDVLVLPRSGWKTFAVTALPGVSTAVANAASISLIER